MDIRKFCPYCGEPVISLSSMNIKLCSGCKKELPWILPEDKDSIFGDRKGVGSRKLAPSKESK